MDLEKIGKFIKELRTEKGLSQNKLSEQIHITRQAISNWENGKALPDSDMLKELSKLFKVSIDEILSGEKHKNENHLEEITLSLVDEHNKNQSKIKKMFIALFATVSSFIILFLLFYFIMNYNSIKVYMVSGETDNYVIREGMIISTQQKNYVRIGELMSRNNQKIESLELYFMNNKNERVSLYKIESKDYIIFNYSIHKIEEKNHLKHLFMDIKIEDNKTETMKIDIQEDFKNSFYFNMKNMKKRDLNYEDNNIEMKEEEKIEPEIIKEIIPGEPPEPIIVIQKDNSLNYLDVIRKIENKGLKQVGKYTIESIKEDMYLNISCSNYDIFIDTMKDNIIESMQINIIDQVIIYQKFDNYIEVEKKKMKESNEEYEEHKNKIEEILKEELEIEG